MNKLTRLLKWILKAAIFFALFAFALNNQHDATVYLLFGHQWRGPMMLIVLAAFVVGVFVGALGMLPGWWRRRPPAASPAAAFEEAPTSAESRKHEDALLPAPPHGI